MTTGVGRTVHRFSPSMSTTQATSFQAVRQYTPADAFDEFVFHNPDTCSECFERIKQTEVDIVPYGTVGTRERQWSHRAGAGVLGHGEVGNRVFAPRTFCGECGSQSGRAYSDTLTQRQAVNRARTLADRLDEAGIPTNERVLRYSVRKLKSDTRIQGMDREIFARATKLAIQKAES